MIIGNSNQLDKFEDKLGGSIHIKGWQNFNNWKIDSRLIDIPYIGPQYTWTNKRSYPHTILKRLDRGYMTNS